MAVKVGSAYSSWDLDLSPLRRSIAEAKRLAGELDQTFDRTYRPRTQRTGADPIADALKRQQREADQALRRFEALERQYRQQQTAAARLADSEIRVARATGDHAAALNRIEREIAQASAGTVRYNQLLAQQAQIQRQVAAETERTAAAARTQRSQNVRDVASGVGGALGGPIGALAGAGGAAGIAGVGVGMAVQGGAAAAGDALELTRISNGLRIASGSLDTYSKALQIADRNQILFGGTLGENRAALVGLANIARRTGIDIAQLNDLSQQLRAVDPEASISDAQIAIREFASGDITSLAERFELPRKELLALRDAAGGDTRVALEGLAKLLTDAGYSATTAADAIPETTKRLRELEQQAEKTRIGIGNVIASYAALALFGRDGMNGAGDGGVGGIGGALQRSAAFTAAFIDSIRSGGGFIESYARGVAAVAVETGALATVAERQAAAQDQATASIQRAAGTYDTYAGINRDLADRLERTQQIMALMKSSGDLARSGLFAAAGGVDALAGSAARANPLVDSLLGKLDNIAGRAGSIGGVNEAAGGPAFSRFGSAAGRAASGQARTANVLSRASDPAAPRGSGRSAEALARSTATALDRIEDRTEDHYIKLLQLQQDYQLRALRSQEDFDVRRTRGQEDYERQRRRLLAEGKIFEAQQLKEDFERQQRRDREDFDRARAREAQDSATQVARQAADANLDVSRIQERAAIRGVSVPGAAAAADRAAAGVAPAVSAPGAGVSGGSAAAVNLALTLSAAVYLDGERVGDLVFDRIDDRFADGILNLTIASPPGNPNAAAVGGPRP